MPDDARAYREWTVQPPFIDYVWFTEGATPHLMWSDLHRLANIPALAEPRFRHLGTRRPGIWREFRNYVRQAQAYGDAATSVRGSSAALLHYYSSLNLAKAELLITDADSIYQKRVGHGLSYSPTRAKTLSGDALIVQDGVFRHLYEKRLGRPLPVGTHLPVKRLLLQCPEIAWEIDELGFGVTNVANGMYAWVADDTHVWSVCAVQQPDHILMSGPLAMAFRSLFKPIAPPRNWRDHFAVTRRTFAPRFSWYEARTPQKRLNPNSFGPELIVMIKAFAELGPYLSVPTDPAYEFELSGSLYKSRPFPMPPFFARYALMFYVSSLVRYKPSQLDPVSAPSQAWLLDEFTRQSAPYLLSGAVSGITGETRFYVPNAAIRR